MSETRRACEGAPAGRQRDGAASPRQVGVVRLTRRSFHGRGGSRPSETRASGTVGSSRQRGMTPGQLRLGSNARCVDHRVGRPWSGRIAEDAPPPGAERGGPAGLAAYHGATGTSVHGGAGRRAAGRASAAVSPAGGATRSAWAAPGSGRIARSRPASRPARPPHQAAPGQPARLDEGGRRRTPGSAIDPRGPEPLSTPPLTARSEAQDPRACRCADVQEPSQPPAARGERRSRGPRAHPGVGVAGRLGALPQPAPHHGDRALTWGTERADAPPRDSRTPALRAPRRDDTHHRHERPGDIGQRAPQGLERRNAPSELPAPGAAAHPSHAKGESRDNMRSCRLRNSSISVLSGPLMAPFLVMSTYWMVSDPPPPCVLTLRVHP